MGHDLTLFCCELATVEAAWPRQICRPSALHYTGKIRAVKRQAPRWPGHSPCCAGGVDQ